MNEHVFDLSAVIQHNRELLEQGKAEAEYVDALNNWYMKVDAFCKSSGKSFEEVAVWIPAPAKAFTTQDNGAVVDAPNYFVLRPDGAELIFTDKE